MKKIFTIAMAALAITAMSCQKDNTGNDNGGDNGKKEITVAKDALVAYFPFEDENEVAAGLTLAQKGKTGEANFVAGRTGKCFQGGEDVFLLYDLPENSPISGLKAYTVSMWVNQVEIPQEQVPTPLYFSILGEGLFWGNMTVVADRGGVTGNVALKNVIHWDGLGEKFQAWNGDYGECYPAGRWNHIIYSYDNVTSTFHAYSNGVEVNVSDIVWGDPAAPAGDIVFTAPTQIIIGAWKQKALEGATDEWMGWMDGTKLDELRLYNRALTAEEINELYKAEINNIN